MSLLCPNVWMASISRSTLSLSHALSGPLVREDKMSDAVLELKPQKKLCSEVCSETSAEAGNPETAVPALSDRI
eukprot:5923611-Amphidinium_carterae.1